MNRDTLIKFAIAAVSVAIITLFFWHLCELDTTEAQAVEVVK